MNSPQNDIHPLVQALMESVPQSLRDDLAVRFALCLQYSTPNNSYELLTVDASNVVAESRKSENAFLDIPRFFRTVGELAVEGTAMYQAPFLFIPIALRMMRISREVVSRELGNRQTAILLVLHETATLGSDLQKLFAKSKEILRNANLPETNDEDLNMALKDLLQLRCVKRTTDNVILISEKVEISDAS